MDLKSLINRIQELSEAKEPDFKPSISKKEKAADFSTKPHEKRGTKVKGTRYGAQDDEDEDDEDDKKKPEEPKVKRGRGRPKNNADSETGEVAKYDFGKELQGWIVGNIPKKSKELEKLPSKKHKLKDWMEHVEQSILNEEQVKMPLPVMGQDKKSQEAVLTSTSSDPATANALKAAGELIKSGKAQIQMPVSTSNQSQNSMGQQTTQQSNQAQKPMGQQQQMQPMTEEDLEEVAAPGQEEWIRKNKARFIDQYGKKKGLSVLYATAWKRSKKKDESIVRKGSKKVMEGYTLEDIMERYPHESKQCAEGYGMDEGLYEELCEYYFKEGRIPRRVWHGSPDELRSHVEECYMEDTGIDLHGREMLDEFENEMASSGDAHLSPLSEYDDETNESSEIDRLLNDSYMDEDLSSDIVSLDGGDEVDATPKLSKELYLDDEMMSEMDEFPKPTRITAPDVEKSKIPAYLRLRKPRDPDDRTAGPLTLDDLEDEQDRLLSRLEPLGPLKENKMRKDPQMEAWDRQLKSLLKEAEDKPPRDLEILAGRENPETDDEREIKRLGDLLRGGKPPRNSHDDENLDDIDVDDILGDLPPAPPSKKSIKEGMTVSTSTGQQGVGDSVSVNATDEDAHKLMKILQSAGISPLMGGDHEHGSGTMIDVEPMAQDEVMAQLSSDDDSGEGDLDFLKRMIGARGGDSAEMNHGSADDYEQEQGHEDHDHTEEVCSDCDCDPCECDDEHDEHGEVIMVGEGDDEDVEEGNEFTKARLDAIKAGKDTFRVGKKTYHVKGDTSDEKRQVGEAMSPKEKRKIARELLRKRVFYNAPDHSVSGKLVPGHDELARRAELKQKFTDPDELLTAYGGIYGDDYKEKDRYGDMHKIAGPQGPLPESEDDIEEQMCEQCGDTMSEEHSCAPEKLDEWANSPAGKSRDEDFQTELDYMTKLISGGLNGMKQDQTTLPHTRVKSELSEAGDVATMMKRLAGIRK